MEPSMRGNWRIYHHHSLDSTNLEALRLAEREALAWTAIRADTQTEGRGRLGRTWTDVPGRCLLLTALVHPPRGAEGLLGPAMALAAGQALEHEGASDLAIKWPNDLLLGDRKVAGVLAEGPRNDLMAVGIGLNANGDPADLPEDLRDAATFASEHLGRVLDIDALADTVLARFAQHHHSLIADDRSVVVDAIRARDCLAGECIRAGSGDAVVEGRVVGWTDDGRLAIIDADGREAALDAGEVTLI